MPDGRPDDVLRAAYDAVRKYGSFFAAARALRRDRNTLTSQFYEAVSRFNLPDPRSRKAIPQDVLDAARAGELGFKPVLPGFTIKSTSAKTDDGAWVKQVREPGDEFSVPAGHRVKGVSALVDPDGREIAKWIKTAQGAPSPEEYAEALKVALGSITPTVHTIKAPSRVASDILTTYVLADLHLGLFSWAKETGQDYDLKIAERLLIDAMRVLVDSAPESETAILLNLGDFIHADSVENKTARSGNVLDVDSRWPKVLQTAIRLMAACVDMALTKHKRVIVRNLPGNHDYHAAIAITAAIGAFYRNEKRVAVDDDPSKFFFHQHGKVMLAATHGDTVKPDQFAGVCAAMRPQLWGACQWRHGIQGHVHHKSKHVSEGGGMVVETFQTLAAKDAYHAAAGYQSNRSMSAVSFHKDRGEFSRQTVAVQQDNDIHGARNG